MGKNKTNGFFITVGILLISVSLFVNKFSSYSISQLAENVSVKIKTKLKNFESPLNKLLLEGSTINKEKLYKLFEKEKTGLYLYHHDSLLIWNNAQIPITDSLLKITKEEGVIKLKQGYYLFKKQKKNNYTAFALSLIKSKYDLQNNHLKNEFSEWTNIPKDIELADKTATLTDVSLDETKLFSLKGNDQYYYNPWLNILCLVLFLTGGFILFISLLIYFKKHNSVTNAGAIVLLLIVIKFLMIFSHPFKFLSDTCLYDVHLFGNAQSLINAHLGDIIFNSAALLFISLIFYFQPVSGKNKWQKIITLFLHFALVFVTVWQFNHSLQSMVTNSTLSFDFLNVFSIKVGAIISLLSLVFNSIALFILLYKALGLFNNEWWFSFMSFTLCNLFVCIALKQVAGHETLFQQYWLLLFSTILFILVKLQIQKFSFALGFLIAIMSATTAGFFNHFIAKNQKENLTHLSTKLSERQDAQLENEFITLPAKIANDQNFINLINFLPETKKEIDQLLRQKYFRGYFNRYNVDFSLFDQDCKPLLKPSQAILLNEGYFEDRIKFYSDSISSSLFFVSKYKKNSQYISKIKLNSKNLYILLEPKQFEDLGSFPDLLLDESQQKPEKLKNFSWAVYRSNQKTNRDGDFNYPYYFIDSTALSKSNPEYIHHYFKTDDETEIIISEKTKDWKYFFTYNSYVFLFFSFVTFICYFIYAWFFTKHYDSPSLTRRIQTIIIVLLLLAMSAVGITSGNLVSRQFYGDNVKQLQEKSQTIISELGLKYKPDDLFSPSQKELINSQLQEYVHLYNSDISLFDSNGLLFNTSQPKLYELGLAASLSNPKAYFNLKGNQSSAYHVTEKAGTLNYQSLYSPIFNEHKKLIGFLNLPYFAKQSDLTNELSNIISALINVYIILFVVSILAGLILSGYITKPLRLIKQQISNITLGKQNEALKWNSNDEVGKLVNEYNNMLLKLEHGANLLAQSERESAWREMAKQVAHEIKNPLTPMKLNLQYLQHVMKNSPADFNEKFEKASASIIEQIDTLAGIATEFSNFAKLPGTQLRQINLLEIINSSVNLFEQKKNVSIIVDIRFKDIQVMGDKEQALRVFNNIIKNAIQATQDVERAEIVISAEEKAETYIIKVKDNGCGIAENMKDKIFTPNFTTKSTGSGLGLAMVKNIISNFGGNIWFTSEENTGTVFFIEFKKG